MYLFSGHKLPIIASSILEIFCDEKSLKVTIDRNKMKWGTNLRSVNFKSKFACSHLKQKRKKHFLISALASKNGSNQKNEGI